MDLKILIRIWSIKLNLLRENETEVLLLKYKQGNNIHKHGNCKANEPHNFVFNLSQRLDLRSSKKHFALQNIYLPQVKNIRKSMRTINLK